MSIPTIETLRLKLLDIAFYNILIRISLVVFWTFIVVYYKWEWPLAMIGFVACYGFTLAWFQFYYKDFCAKFKRTVVTDLIKSINPKANYLPGSMIPKEIFNGSRLFKTDYTGYWGEDLISFETYGNLQIGEIKVTKVENYTDSEGKAQTRIDQYYSGLFGVATFPFDFEGFTTVVSRNSFSRLILSKEEVRLESPRFMEIWKVNSDNQIGARLALGTDIMNNLLYLQEKIKAKISMSFVNNQVFFAIEQAKFLEPNYKKSVLEQDSVKELQEELQVIQNIIETFKLQQSK